MAQIDKLCESIDKLSESTFTGVKYLTPLLAIMLTAEAVRRYAFNAPSVWAYETALFMFSAMFLFGSAFTLAKRRHVAIDVAYGFFSERWKLIANIFFSLMLFLFCGIAAWQTGLFAWGSFLERECALTTWDPPLYPLRIAITVGMLTVLLQGFAIFMRNVRALFRSGKG